MAKKKDIVKKRLDQANADRAENNRRVRGTSKGWEKDAESKMEPWRKLENKDEGGLAGKTYIHSGETTRNKSRTPDEQIKYLNKAGNWVANKNGKITKAGRKQRKQLRNIQNRRQEAKDAGLTEKEMINLYGKEWMEDKPSEDLKGKKGVTYR